MYYIGKIIGAFFNQLFRWLFWNKTGQKVLFSILFVVIFFVFIKCGEVAAVEEVQDVNVEAYTYYDSVINDAIVRLYKLYQRDPNNSIFGFLKNTQDFHFIFYYGNSDGSSYNGSIPLSDKNLYITLFNSYQSSNLVWSPTSNDYGGVTGFTMYEVTYSNSQVFGRFNFNGNLMSGYSSFNKVYFPYKLFNYVSENWEDFLTYFNNGDTQSIINLLEEIEGHQSNIEDALTNTDPTSETDSFVNVDTSSTDNVDTSNVDNIFSSLVTDWGNKFQYYDFSQDMYQYVINIKGTNIVIRSDLIYNMIKDTWFYPLLQLLWYYIFGHYAFVWLSNLIHRIKDGSILDGLNPHDVLTSEIL